MSAAVIFDMDGVLVDSAAAHGESWRQVARQHGIDVTDEQFRRTFGRPSRDIIRIIWGSGLSDAQIVALDEEKEAAYRQLITGRVPLMPGARQVLERLGAAGYALAVATSGPRANVELVLREAGWEQAFDAVVTGFDVQHGKPAPDCFLLAARRLDLPPNCCVVIEDAPVGITAARAADMPAIALAGTHPPEPLRAAGASVVVENLDEITPALVAKLLENARPTGG